MRYLGVVLFAALLASISMTGSANADTVYVDLTQPGGIPGTGGTFTYNPGCYCGSGVTEIYSPIYQFAAGTTVDFGHLDIFTRAFGQSTPDAGPTQPNLYINGLIGVSISYSLISPFPTPPDGPSNLIYFLCSISDSNCNANAQNFKQSLDLIFTIPAEASSIQIEWGAINDVYTPAVPEPSTWAMLLIGFAALGAFTHRRRVLLQ